MMATQRTEIARKVLNGVSRRDREILNRFYVLEQPQERICAEMGLSYNQFRLLKSRAKARFGELGKRVAAGSGINLRKNN
jgi:RNA polymerase sigma-70 factor, ECF subfamily